MEIRKVWRRPSAWMAAALLAGAGAFSALWIVSGAKAARFARARNGVYSPPPYTVGQAARDFHAGLFVADLHADTLLWTRDFFRKNDVGQVDLPRLVEGGAALQVFSVVTRFPRWPKDNNPESGPDAVKNVLIGQKWPLKTWGSLKQRAFYQAEKLRRIERDSGGQFVIIRTREDLDRFLERRLANPRLVAGLLAVEGAHALEGRPENVDAFYDAGFRMISLSHYQDSEMGGSAHGMGDLPLTDKGREMIRRMEEKGIVLDLSHASPAAFSQALAFSKNPVVVSHTGARAIVDSPRNLSDSQIRAVAKTGGVVGGGFWPAATGGETKEDVLRTLLHLAKVAGPDGAGLGSDFDGAVMTPFDASGLPLLTEGLLKAGLPRHTIAKLMGGNLLRVLRRVLPSESELSGTRP